MADEVNLQVITPGQPQQVQAEWKANPPKAFASEGYKLIDEAYDALTYESRYYDWPQKVLFVTTFGFALLFKGFMGSYFKLTARFDAEGEDSTKITIIGTAHPRTRLQLTTLADQYGGSVGLRVGV
jgi:hypothetical protein